MELVISRCLRWEFYFSITVTEYSVLSVVSIFSKNLSYGKQNITSFSVGLQKYWYQLPLFVCSNVHTTIQVPTTLSFQWHHRFVFRIYYYITIQFNFGTTAAQQKHRSACCRWLAPVQLNATLKRDKRSSRLSPRWIYKYYCKTSAALTGNCAEESKGSRKNLILITILLKHWEFIVYWHLSLFLLTLKINRYPYSVFPEIFSTLKPIKEEDAALELEESSFCS
jgi:hypothetical protein